MKKETGGDCVSDPTLVQVFRVGLQHDCVTLGGSSHYQVEQIVWPKEVSPLWVDDKVTFSPLSIGRGRAGLVSYSILFCLGKKSFICLEGRSVTPRRGNTILFRSSQQLTRLGLGAF